MGDPFIIYVIAPMEINDLNTPYTISVIHNHIPSPTLPSPSLPLPQPHTISTPIQLNLSKWTGDGTDFTGFI